MRFDGVAVQDSLSSRGRDYLWRFHTVLRARVRAGKLRVVGVIYDINSGRMNQLGIHPKQNVSLSGAIRCYRLGK